VQGVGEQDAIQDVSPSITAEEGVVRESPWDVLRDVPGPLRAFQISLMDQLGVIILPFPLPHLVSSTEQPSLPTQMIRYPSPNQPVRSFPRRLDREFLFAPGPLQGTDRFLPPAQ